MPVELITYLGDKRFPRGIRNNNFGNLERSRATWKGKIPFSESKDKRFEQFFKAWYGYRALIITLRSYYFKHKLTTVRAMINRWAPSAENNTSAYIDYVSQILGADSDQELTWNQPTVFKLVYAIEHHENGQSVITRDLFDYAWDHI